MRKAIVTLLIVAASSGASFAKPPIALHVVPSRPAVAAAVSLDRAVMTTRPLPAIKAYFPQEYRQIATVVEGASRAHQSDGEIAGTISRMSNAVMGAVSPYYNTDNTIEYMVISRDMLKYISAEMPDECVEFMRPDGRLSAAARVKLAAMVAKQPAWRFDMIEASLKQAATVPSQPTSGTPDPIIVQAVREIAIQDMPESLRPYLHPIDPSQRVSAQESEAACRYTSGVIDATLQLPPEQAVATFKQLSRPARGLWSVSERLLPSNQATVLLVATRNP